MATWREKLHGWLLRKLAPKKIEDGTMAHFEKIWRQIKSLEMRGDQKLEEKIAQNGKIATGMLLTALNHRNPVVRCRIIQILGAINDNRAVDDLIARIKDSEESPLVKEAAMDALVALKTDRATQALAGVIASGQGKEVWQAASTMERIGRESVPALIKLLYGSPETKAVALATLRRISGQSFGEEPEEWTAWHKK